VLNLTYEYKALPTNEQIELIEHTLTVCLKVWNFALRERKDWINSRKCSINACSIVSESIIPADAPYPSYEQQCKERWRCAASARLVTSFENPPCLSRGSVNLSHNESSP
jgi:putative transposase